MHILKLENACTPWPLKHCKNGVLGAKFLSTERHSNASLQYCTVIAWTWPPFFTSRAPRMIQRFLKHVKFSASFGWRIHLSLYTYVYIYVYVYGGLLGGLRFFKKRAGSGTARFRTIKIGISEEKCGNNKKGQNHNEPNFIIFELFSVIPALWLPNRFVSGINGSR